MEMSIGPYLDGLNVDRETERLLGLALDMTRVALELEGDLASRIIAKTIIEVAKAGERNPDLLCEGALKKLRQHHLFGD
jgi:hypothetical protein